MQPDRFVGFGGTGRGGERSGEERRGAKKGREGKKSFPEHIGACDSPTPYSNQDTMTITHHNNFHCVS